MTDFVETNFFKHSICKNKLFAPSFNPTPGELKQWNILAQRYDAWLAEGPLETVQIPKIIHQIWLGSPLPEKYAYFVTSWKKKHPDWQYILWDEKKIQALENFSCKRLYEKSKSYGAKSDIARYEILKQFGGIYVDTDFECIKPFDDLIKNSTFLIGINNDPHISFINALIGCTPNHRIMHEAVNSISSIKSLSTELMDIINTTGPGLTTRLILEHIQDYPLSDAFLPAHYFYPYPNFEKNENLSKKEAHSYIQEKTFAIHYWEVSWSKVDFISFFIRKWNRLIKKIKRNFLFRKEAR